MPIPKDKKIIIIGAGVFGLSTALELSKRGYNNITILDRHVPPVVDGSSVDISRIIRFDYADPLYARMAKEAYQGWQKEYSDFFYQSGFVMLAKDASNVYVNKSMENVRSQGGQVDVFHNANDVKKLYAGITSDFSGLYATHNASGGWADAEKSIQRLASECSLAGVSFITGPQGTVHSLRQEGSRIVGVNTVNGGTILASQVILCTGAWSNRLLNLTHTASASGQPVGFIKLTPDEARELENTPVMINMTTGVFCFPPTPGTNILKLARHGHGYATEAVSETTGRVISSPRREGSNAKSGYLPDDADEALRDGLRQFFPKLEGRAWMRRRLCWYTDTPTGDFIIDHHSALDGLFVATGGAGQ
ncbi:uncharacterized protein BHQ10_000990 [Talaromyces amestolkiae]|uniref:FAD dependent oxidoreductase domain-containing protein n=1 Tax=Talaromyces amestolkiae TaxID=1196081 RepID=A0A364KN47_TALAM|nr:uncharacterized protein BHQ10_000990 [Talaromyces amestolkiae]RAO64978.1 hypothetical protein BHQ10_000990 [Talaromyces amestolkiae]